MSHRFFFFFAVLHGLCRSDAVTRRTLIIVSLWAGTLLSGPAAGATKPVTVVAFGDSTTAERGSLEIYTKLLQEELRNVTVINAGISGNTTAMARQRFDKDVLSHSPQVVIIQFGINDSAVDVWKKPPASKPRLALEDYEANLRYFVQTLNEKKVLVVLMTANPLRWTPKLKEMYGKTPYDPGKIDGFNVLLDKYSESVRRIARDEDVPLIDVSTAFEAEARRQGVTVDTMLSDGMHPNDTGHRVVADLLREKLLALGEAQGLSLAAGPLWHPSGESVMLNPACADITFDSSDAVVLGSGVARLRDGGMMAVYSTPSSYYSKKGTTRIVGRTTKDGGETWGPEQVIARDPDSQPSHASVMCSRDGVIHVYYLGFKQWKWEGVNPTDEAQSDVFTTRSSDHGVTWSTPQKIFEGYSGATNGAIETREGRLVVPYSHYVKDPGRLVSRVSVSADGGKTWQLGAPIDIGGAGDHEGALEPALLELSDGRIWMLIRTTRRVFWESFSSDGGLTWTPAQATTISATSAPGHLARLKDDRIALVWNRQEKGRKVLYLALSADEGNTWSAALALARGKSVTYPFVIEGEPGDLWVGYHDVPRGWNFPRARYLRVPVTAVHAR